jgi:tetratricopeptide (TPR) repeat protein
MTRLLLAVALFAACRGEGKTKTTKDDAAPSGAASSVSDPAASVPKLPKSPDGMQELAALDGDIDHWRTAPDGDVSLVNLLIARAAITQRLEDYLDALVRSAKLVGDHPTASTAWKTRALVLSRVHRLAAAREAVAKLKTLGGAADEWESLEATIDEATGKVEQSSAYRERVAKINASPSNITMQAMNLALRAKLPDAVALIPKAASAVVDNSPFLYSWLYFQWGRIYEQKGELVKAREHFAEAHRRLPGHVEVTAHLAATMTATGQDPSGILGEALVTNRHPELLALAGNIDEAKQAWERYVAGLPEAFSDHAARFYLGAGKDPLRALVLAQANLKNRDTTEARSLVIEAALAASAPAEACSVVDPVIESPLRAQQFIAWRALTACGRKADADKLAATLGIR